MSKTNVERREHVPDPPSGWETLKWYGPGLVWMVSAVGSGSVLFTPRIGAKYGYEFVWMAMIFFFLMFVMIREVGRYTVVTGKTIFEGYSDISGKSNWALYFILIPAMVAAVVTIGGIAALTSSALMIAYPWVYEGYAVVLVVGSLILVITGRYQIFERILSALAGVLVTIIIIASIKVFESPQDFVEGLVPGIPADTDFNFVLPWVGFILAGASGIMWFSYWVSAREYGGKLTSTDEMKVISQDDKKAEPDQNEKAYNRIDKWIKTMSGAAAIGVVGGGLVLLGFLVLGTELLKPQGIMPEGIDVAKDLTKLLSDVWGEAGKWMLITGMCIALLGTILSNQDGYGRMFADGTEILAIPFFRKKKWIDGDSPDDPQKVSIADAKVSDRKRKVIKFILNQPLLRKIYAVLLGAVCPLIVFFIVKNPVDILSVAGTIAAVHTPVVVYLTSHLNRTRLPERVRPGAFFTVAMWLAGIAYGAFAVFLFVSPEAQ